MTTHFKGIGAAPGIAIGKAILWRREEPAAEGAPALGPEAELARLGPALKETRRQLRDLARTVAAQAGDKEARIFQAHLLLIDDPLLMREIKDNMEQERLRAEEAVNRAVVRLAGKFEALPDNYLRERAADIRDVGQRLVSNLSRGSSAAPGGPESGILVARNLTPSEIALLDRGKILAVVTEEGGGTGHAAILARALNLVAVTGVKDILSAVRGGDWLVVDGATGELIVRPDEETLELSRQQGREERLGRERLASLRDLAAVTPDGFRTVLEANIAAPSEAGQALAAGAEGIGLFRTEYLFVNRMTPPSEEEQFEAYREVLSKMAPRRVVIRTMDIGGDKGIACWDLPQEPNPALGMRGIRLSLEREGDFRCQLRALMRAAAAGNLAILLPMIADIGEVRRTRQLLDQIRDEIAGAGRRAPGPIPLGIMIETPAAAILVGDLAQEADFFSIGTNDLIQYLLAADRTSESAVSLYQPFHPAVLRLMSYVALVARQSGKRVAVCGEMAADPLAAPLFVGMEMDELSMNPAAIPAVKDAIRRTTRTAAAALLNEALRLGAAAEAVELLRSFREERDHPECSRER
jgi:phosphotransferase system enzyme I (PtsI)